MLGQIIDIIDYVKKKNDPQPYHWCFYVPYVHIVRSVTSLLPVTTKVTVTTEVIVYVK